jgi:homoserine O-acetyltransferase/O-succinyltransferase
MSATPNVHICDVGDVTLQCGMTLPSAKLVIATYGSLSAARDNVIVYPTRFGGGHEDNAYLIGPGMALDPARYFIVVPNLLGNGISSSPSNAPSELGGGHFPPTTIYDNVVLQRRVLAARFDVERVLLAVGWSMGAHQSYHWATLFADSVERLAVICGCAKTTPHTRVFLEGMRATLTCDPAWEGGSYRTPPVRGLRAIGRAWAGWGLSHGFYNAELFHTLGYSSVEDFLVRWWESIFLHRDANDVLSMLDTWQHADISANDTFGGDFAAAMDAISAETLLLPSETDMYFPWQDSERECTMLRRGQVVRIPSVWGHYAGGSRNPDDVAFVDRALTSLLATS